MKRYIVGSLFSYVLFWGSVFAQETDETFEDFFYSSFPKDSIYQLIFEEFPEEEKAYREYLKEIYKTETDVFIQEKIKWLRDKLDAWYFKHFLRYATDESIYEFLKAKSRMLTYLRENHINSCFGWMRDRVDATKFTGFLLEAETNYREGEKGVFFSARENWGKEYKTKIREKAFQELMAFTVRKGQKKGLLNLNIHYINGPLSTTFTPDEQSNICRGTSYFYEFLLEEGKKDAVILFRSFIGEELLDINQGRIINTIK